MLLSALSWISIFYFTCNFLFGFLRFRDRFVIIHIILNVFCITILYLVMRRREVIDCVSVLFDLIKIVEVDNFYMYIKLQRRLKPAGLDLSLSKAWTTIARGQERGTYPDLWHKAAHRANNRWVDELPSLLIKQKDTSPRKDIYTRKDFIHAYIAIDRKSVV